MLIKELGEGKEINDHKTSKCDQTRAHNRIKQSDQDVFKSLTRDA